MKNILEVRSNNYDPKYLHQISKTVEVPPEFTLELFQDFVKAIETALVIYLDKRNSRLKLTCSLDLSYIAVQNEFTFILQLSGSSGIVFLSKRTLSLSENSLLNGKSFFINVYSNRHPSWKIDLTEKPLTLPLKKIPLLINHEVKWVKNFALTKLKGLC